MYFCKAKMTLTDFILQHAQDDPVRLLLSRDKYPDIDLDLAVTTLEVRRKLRTKVPQWYAVPSLVYPSRLSGEQCSSSETARYKASLAAGAGREDTPPETCGHPRPHKREGPAGFGSEAESSLSDDGDKACGRGRSEAETVSGGVSSRPRIADLTGGMGVDSWAFSQVAEAVLYNEMNEALVHATRLNFKELGIWNVRFRNERVEPGKVAELLDGFEPDVIYLDPARRAEDGKKVFLIEECQPDVLALLPELFAASRYVLLKLSPMADITMACKRLEHVREVHVVASGGECKELLFLLDREWDGLRSTFAVEDGSVMAIPSDPSAASTGSATGSGSVGNPVVAPGASSFVISTGAKRSGEIFLFEPGKALTKAGAFGLPCDRYGLNKLGEHTHLYVGETVPEELRPFGKRFEILEVLPLNNRTMKEVGKRWPQAEVTARNIPMTSELLRRKTGCVSGGDIHVFGARADGPSKPGNYLIITKRNERNG